MTLDTFIDQTLHHATASLTLARSIRAQLQAPDYLWRPFRFTN